jgi:hypothetical protein
MLTPAVYGTALGIVSLAGIFLLALASSALFTPSRATAFLMSFATTPGKHYLELAVRILVGIAFVVSAPHMAFESAFSVFGWLLIGTSLALGVLPWHLHQRFASHAVPRVVRHMPVVGVASLVFGAVIIGAVVHGAA